MISGQRLALLCRVHHAVSVDAAAARKLNMFVCVTKPDPFHFSLVSGFRHIQAGTNMKIRT